MKESEELRLALIEIEQLKEELRYSREVVRRNRQMVAGIEEEVVRRNLQMVAGIEDLIEELERL